jgi:hypothetical protein
MALVLIEYSWSLVGFPGAVWIKGFLEKGGRRQYGPRCLFVFLDMPLCAKR